MALTKIEANPQIDFNGVSGFCAEEKCLRKCRNTADEHVCGEIQSCHDGPCWPSKEK